MIYQLRLYISGRTRNSQKAIENLRQLCESDLRGRYEIEIVDTLEHPDRARKERVMATPTLLKRRPAPVRRIIGDLSDRRKVLADLDLVPNGRA